MSRASRSVIVLISIWALAGCASQAAPTPALPSRLLAGQAMPQCLVSGEIPVKAEVPGLCGTLQVPEDRSRPSGRKIGLRVAVVPAVSAAPAADPVFALAGGPGDASSQFFAWLPGLYAGVHATHDIVLVDQRGTGASNPLTLPEMPDTSGLSAADADTRLSAWMHDGLAALDADPRFYTSTVAADDLDDVRAALGYDKVDLYGTSYGGTLAQYYLRQHADHVRAAVLDGATPLDVPVLERMAASSQAALNLLLKRCEQEAACHSAFPQVSAEWSALVSQLATGVTTNVDNPQTGGKWVADLTAVGPAIHNALMTEGAAAQLPLAIHLASQNKWDQATQLVPAPATGGPSRLMADEIFCSEAWARFDAAAISSAGAGSYALPMELARAGQQATMCRYLPKGLVPEHDDAAVATPLPVLWLTGDGDPQDPPANLAAVPVQEPNSLIVVMPAQEHVVGHLGCGPKVIAAFLDAGTGAGLDIACIAQGAPSPAFRLS
jgi:pimeloyl-ACP methyl ester carboxylesterase